jgi:hypothetical protein
MIDKFVYILLIGILVYIFIVLEKELTNEYYNKGLSKNPPGTGRFFFIPLIFPRNYFIKNKLLEGWLVYLFSLIAFFSALYFLIKLLGIV